MTNFHGDEAKKNFWKKNFKMANSKNWVFQHHQKLSNFCQNPFLIKPWKKFFLFLNLRRTVWWPYRLNHINALGINLFYWPKDKALKFLRKNIENWWLWKTQFFELAILNFLFFASSPLKSVKVSWVARMSRNFDDYSGFQLKTTPAQSYATQCMYPLDLDKGESTYCLPEKLFTHHFLLTS